MYTSSLHLPWIQKHSRLQIVHFSDIVSRREPQRREYLSCLLDTGAQEQSTISTHGSRDLRLRRQHCVLVAALRERWLHCHGRSSTYGWQHCAKVSALYPGGSTVQCTMVTALCHGGSTVPWWQHCAMVAALCPGGSTVPWCQHYALVAAMCQGGSTVPWWQHSALVSALEGYSPRNPSCPPKVMTS